MSCDGASNDMIYGFADDLTPDWLIPGTQISWFESGEGGGLTSDSKWGGEELKTLFLSNYIIFKKWGIPSPFPSAGPDLTMST